ncbi:McrB family protein [Tenacibaculum sp. 1_MG-2023]|uniref:McrB family protein n=1 Tax=Tenacibaculum sp. 1_MG-2023 TaxID=3062653 RepID=UPI0026E40293|nr:AAA family ATPase [Tenacibaculum sp. 1_MG-2023]MDO6600641.1 AAA family ATPase [Tenacibaculum sp. 1_MG-2023]
MLFEKVKREHVLKGIKDFEEKGLPNGFGPSSTYDLIYNDKPYPPKAIMAYANYYAEGRKIERYFKGGLETDCFKTFYKNGFNLVVKSENKLNLNLKKEFINWLTNNVKNNYYDNDKNKIAEALNKYNTFFKIDIFSHDIGINKLITFINDQLYSNINQAFFEYSKGVSNHLPRAILGKKNYLTFLNKKNLTNALSNNDEKFTWVKTHLQITDYLKAHKNNQLHLIEILKKAGVTGFSDRDVNNVDIDLEVIDPFTFFCYIYKYGDERRLKVLQNIANDLKIHYPKDEFGIPSSNAQKVWLFPYKEIRVNKEIERLWSFFFEVLDEEINNDSFEDLLQIRGIARTKLTEALFNVNPKKYFPINGPTKPYLENVFSINPKFKTFEDYKKILNQIQLKTNKPFYQLSYEAWLWNDEQNKKKTMELNIIDTLKEEFIEFLKYSNYAESTVQIYSDNFEKYLEFYFKNKIIDKLDGDYFYELSNVSRGNYDRKTHFEHRGKGHSNFKSFFKKKLEEFQNVSTKGNSLNQILYGPPGTGKTFYLKNELFDKYTSKQTSITAAQNFETVVSNCSWWQVIAIALLDLKKAKVSDIFEHEWVQKKASLSNSKTIRPTLWGQLQSHTINECEHVNVTSRQQPLLFNKTTDSYWEILENEVEELVPELYDLKDSVDNYNPDPDTIIKHYDFVTFHQSFAYEDFIEGIKPVLPESEEAAVDLGYKIEDGVFKKLCDKADKDPDNRYAIFIDEINRGNVSAIFGELITLIEVDKRKDAKNEMSIKLPYSKTALSVPSNIDIYGTMNTADRSVEALDTALRRRFEFKEMMPNYTVIEDEVVEEIKLSEVLEKINQRIELLIDRDHTIGHSYFVNVNSAKKLANTLNNKIVPLLQEYFYGDYGKIGLVLGNGFVEKIKNDKIDFANFDYENANDFKIASFNLIKVDKNNVIDAVTELLGKKETTL